MAIFFSAAEGGFFHSDIHPTLPADAVPISDDLHQGLLAGQAAGGRIVTGDGGRPRLALPGDEARRAGLVSAVKAEAQRRITLEAPLWRQLNALRAGASVDPMFAHVDRLRAASTALEAVIASADAATLAGLDPAADCHWKEDR